MEKDAHLIFGEKFCQRFDIPEKYAIWAYAPDLGYYFGDELATFLHRFTLHGFKNANKCIELLRETDQSGYIFPYNTDNDKAIQVLVYSHSYLDLFNAPLLPSFPYRREYTSIPSQKSYYAKSAISYAIPGWDPWPDRDKLADRFEEILATFYSIDAFESSIILETELLPTHGFITKRILDLYGGD